MAITVSTILLGTGTVKKTTLQSKRMSLSIGTISTAWCLQQQRHADDIGVKHEDDIRKGGHCETKRESRK